MLKKTVLGFLGSAQMSICMPSNLNTGLLGTRCFVSTGCSSSGLNSRDTDVERQRWVGKGREIGEETDRQTKQQTETERRREGERIGLRKPEL